MSKAKQRALEKYPKMSRISEPHGVIPADNKSHYLDDANEEKREGFIKGYHQAEKDLETASKEWLRPQLDKSYEPYGENKMMELTKFDGYSMMDAIEFGTNWQKEQMMAKAIDGVVTFDYYDSGDKTYGCIAHDSFCLEDFGLKDTDKVKVIVIKED